MADESLNQMGPILPSSVEMEEIDLLRHTLGQDTFDEVQRRTWNEYIATHQPPYAPGVWSAFLEALRAAVRH